MYNLAIAILMTFLIVGCSSSPPKPPTVDGTDRTPINDSKTVETLALRAKLAGSQKQVIALSKSDALKDSSTVVVTFPFNQTKFSVSKRQAQKIRALMNDTFRIEIRGRTDASKPSYYDERIAKKRAMSAKNYLIDQGFPHEKISISFLSAGDYISDNNTKKGRSKNRRVEIEFFPL